MWLSLLVFSSFYISHCLAVHLFYRCVSYTLSVCLSRVADALCWQAGQIDTELSYIYTWNRGGGRQADRHFRHIFLEFCPWEQVPPVLTKACNTSQVLISANMCILVKNRAQDILLTGSTTNIMLCAKNKYNMKFTARNRNVLKYLC